MKQFEAFNLHDDILKAVNELGFVDPTEVQLQAIPILLEGRDAIVRSKTGSGKTAAFGIPILNHLLNEKVAGKQVLPRVLILTPTRELALQVTQNIEALSRFVSISCLSVYGQHSMSLEVQALSKGVDIVIGTPGRVMDHIRQGNLKTKHITYLVLDEADKMMDMGFLDQVVEIVDTLPRARMTALFSATMPFEIQTISWEYMQDPVTIEIQSTTKTVDVIDQLYYKVDPHEKRLYLSNLLANERPKSCMVFCNTRKTVDRVHEFLVKKGYTCDALHGAITQSKRTKTIEQFKKGSFDVLVATDVAARGLHIEDLSLVINYDLPVELDSYVHRIGRTGRAGSGGRAISLVTTDEIMGLYAIEEHIGALIPEGDLNALAKPERHRQRVEAHHKNTIKTVVKSPVTKTAAKQKTIVVDVEPKRHVAIVKKEHVEPKRINHSEGTTPHQIESDLRKVKKVYSSDEVSRVVENYKAKKVSSTNQNPKKGFLNRLMSRLFKK
jgi:ATP-dependent RNA helicase DeaD